MATAKSPLAAPSPRVGLAPGGPSSYFPQHQQYNGTATGPETLPNTLANSHSPQPESNAILAAPVATRPNGRFTEEWDASQRGSSIVDGAGPSSNMHRSNSFSGSVTGNAIGDGSMSLSRSNTLKKKASLRRGGGLKRSGSRRSMKAGSVRSLALQSTTDQDEIHSAFYCPVPTSGSPTEILANRFQAWRKILKDLITYFREIQAHYEHRAKSLIKLGNVLNNTATPAGFLASGGLDDALQILRNYNRQAIVEANKAKEIEEDVILALTGLRSDLHQKIKEIKNLSGDFKNSVEKEMDTTRRAVNHLQEILGQTELDSALTTGKQDPYLLRLAVDRQLERQIDEETYLHQAYLNLENSGRELESIVVGEIQKSYNAYAGILKRESDAAYGAIEELRIGPISMPKDTEWNSFIQRDDRFVDPELPMRSAEFIHYPGRDHHACQEVRAGLLERKSKYLKSYTAGWYVLSPTHLHEFKSADKTQAPVMSLYLPEQKLGSHSSEGGSSNKFVLKGRQTGSMHRGHTWVFRAESHDTMMAWYEDIRALTERTPEERSNFLRGHTRSFSRASQRSSLSSDGMGDDDEEPPFATTSAAAVNQQPKQDSVTRRPSGGRFPSDLQVNAQRGLQVPVSPLSVSSGYAENPDGSISPIAQLGDAREYMNRGPVEALDVTRQGKAAPALRTGDLDGYTEDKRYGQEDRSGFSTAATLEYQHPREQRPFSYVQRPGSASFNHPTGPQTKVESNGNVSNTAPGVKNDSELRYTEYGSIPLGQVNRIDGQHGSQETRQTISGTQAEDHLSRPEGTMRNDSTPHLHVPGEYPRGAAHDSL
ncbi:putative 4,5-bisphosphate-binding protein [Echria macrotheca]|uniref:4,5-bisphosphate-binding protein n=1 Tax=Echria macrotheca TaxID=438768 RepID=A0AAJ0F7L4_9PEZI|nr:putative 4,5-bisphosphate-binding protein [Echria macrotheca]